MRRILLKLSGQAFSATGQSGIGLSELTKVAHQLDRIRQTGVELAIVVGGGNILRGATFSRQNGVVKEATAHYMGMLGTVINGLALQDALEAQGCETRLMTAIRMDGVAEPFIRRRCTSHLAKGRIVILASGTGRPFVTTDTAAALNACEIGASALLKATRVDGVYSEDPEKNPHAIFYSALGYQDVIERRLNVMDMTAVMICQNNNIPIVVFNYTKDENLQRAAAGERVGTLVGGQAQ